MTSLQERIDALEAENSNFQLELTSSREDLERARSDVKRYSDDAARTQELYQHELMQHSNSVQTLLEVKKKVRVCMYVSLAVYLNKLIFPPPPPPPPKKGRFFSCSNVYIGSI